MQPIERSPILISGLPGKMASLIAQAVATSDRFTLLNIGLTSERHGQELAQIDKQNISLFPPEQWDYQIGNLSQGAIVVDYSTPKSATSNGEFFAEHNIPFIMGTTGGDREKIINAVQKSRTCAILAPNMAPSLVAFQAMLEYGAKQFPGALKGYSLRTRESHQETKRDPSGTGNAWNALFQAFGCVMPEEMESVRNRPDAHGHHLYRLSNPDGSSKIELSTQIEGRNPYVEGTMMALDFLQEQIKAGRKGQVFSMIDVLKG